MTDWITTLPPALQDQARRNLRAIRTGLHAHRERNAADLAACTSPRRTAPLPRPDGTTRAGVIPCGRCPGCRSRR